MKRLRSKLTYANVVSTLALFLVVAGGSAFAAANLAKNSVGAKQIKKNAITTAKIADGAVTGAKIAAGSISGSNINLSSLGTVPSAAKADSAGNAGHATTADHAADSATVGGRSAAQLAAEAKLTCPADTKLVAGLCFEKTNRSATTWLNALRTCAQAGRELPSVGALATYDIVTDTSTAGLTSDIYYTSENYFAQVISVTAGGYGLSVVKALGSETGSYRCVVPPTN